MANVLFENMHNKYVPSREFSTVTSEYYDKVVDHIDENGNKIQRYDQAYFIDTDDVSDKDAAVSAIRKADQPYSLTFGTKKYGRLVCSVNAVG